MVVFKRIKRFFKLFTNLRVMNVFSPYPTSYSFVMQKKEKELFNKYVKNSKYYLEFGSGGSTFRVLQISKALVHSVDSDLFWMDQIGLHLYIKYHIKKKRLKFHHVNIGEIKSWGWPKNRDLKELYPNYSSSIFDLIDKRKVDVVFIDGRFRVASALSSIINCRRNKNLIIIIHDFWNRKPYHIVLNYLDEVESEASLAVFKVKKKINLKLIKKDYEKYKYELL